MFKKAVDIWSGTSVATFTTRDLPLMHEAGVRAVRTNASNSDALIRAAAAGGLEIIGLLYNRSVLGPPLNLAAWRTYIVDTVSRLKDVVHVWEIWNEPDQPAYGTVTPSDYIQLLRTAYPAAKLADPSCLVLGGAVSNAGENYGLAYFKQLMDLQLGDWCDAVSYHPYGVSVSPLYPNQTASGKAFWKLVLVREEMLAHGVDKQIWITEIGWNSTTVTEPNQAVYVQQSMALAESWPWCVCYTYYSWQDGGDGNFGLITQSGQRKPAFAAYRDYSSGQPPNCPVGQHWDAASGACVPDSQCPIGTHWDPLQKDCIPDVPPFVLDVAAVNGGTTTPTGRTSYPPGSQVTITATAAQGYVFSGWLVNNQPATMNPLTLTLTESITVMPIFTPVETHICPEGYHWDEQANACVQDAPIPSPEGMNPLILVGAVVGLLLFVIFMRGGK